MALLNYTTTIDAEKTVAEIQRILAAHGAQAVMIYYEDRLPSGVSFAVQTAFGERSYRLPANIGGVERTLRDQHRRGKVPARFATKEQAARVGWRILKDWTEAQMAILESGMVAMEEIFLPYMLARSGQTVYESLTEQELKLALPAPELNGKTT